MIRKTLVFIITHTTKLLAIGATFLLSALILLIYYFSIDLPDYTKIKDYDLSLVTKIYSSNDELLNEYYDEYRSFIPIADTPKALINAFVAAEDKNFFYHNGIDIVSIIRSVGTNVYNITTQQRLVGASTITQQLVKNTLLTPERTIKRKIQEAILAVKITSILPKEKIMELYLNLIYFGNGAYGIGEAAFTYFNKPLTALTLEEMALLAALPKAPSHLNPFTNYQEAMIRRNWVLDKMLEIGMISSQEASQAKNKSLILRNDKMKIQPHAHFFLDEVKKILINKYGEHHAKTKGLKVQSTLHDHYQQSAEQALINGLNQYKTTKAWKIDLKDWYRQLQAIGTKNKNTESAVILENSTDNKVVGLMSGYLANVELLDNMQAGDMVTVMKKADDKYHLTTNPQINGAIVVMEVKTGRILAMAGGYDYHNSQFNIATQAKRQLGSVFKPFVYLAAMEDHFTPATIINDEKIEIKQGLMMPYWQPRNYENRFFGPNMLREGLESSHNVMTVHIARAIGMKKIVNVAKSFNLLDTPSNYAVVLGASEATLLEIVNAYAILANHGIKVRPQFIDSIWDNKRNNIFQLTQPESEQATNAAAAYQVISMLEGSVTRGNARKLKSLGITLAAKTGTTNNSKDAWFIGFTPEIAIGVYVGFDSPAPLGGRRATGSRIALPIFHEFIKSIDINDIPFPIPETITFTKMTAPGAPVKWEAMQKSDICYQPL